MAFLAKRNLTNWINRGVQAIQKFDPYKALGIEELRPETPVELPRISPQGPSPVNPIEPILNRSLVASRRPPSETDIRGEILKQLGPEPDYVSPDPFQILTDVQGRFPRGNYQQQIEDLIGGYQERTKLQPPQFNLLHGLLALIGAKTGGIEGLAAVAKGAQQAAYQRQAQAKEENKFTEDRIKSLMKQQEQEEARVDSISQQLYGKKVDEATRTYQTALKSYDQKSKEIRESLTKGSPEVQRQVRDIVKFANEAFNKQIASPLIQNKLTWANLFTKFRKDALDLEQAGFSEAAQELEGLAQTAAQFSASAPVKSQQVQESEARESQLRAAITSVATRTKIAVQDLARKVRALDHQIDKDAKLLALKARDVAVKEANAATARYRAAKSGGGRGGAKGQRPMTEYQTTQLAIKLDDSWAKEERDIMADLADIRGTLYKELQWEPGKFLDLTKIPNAPPVVTESVKAIKTLEGELKRIKAKRKGIMKSTEKNLKKIGAL